MSHQTSKQKVIITGASTGIGKALAYEYAARGCDVGLVARRASVLGEVRDDILQRSESANVRVETAPLDVTQTDQVPSVLFDLIDRLGGLDVMVVNAGINSMTKIGKGQLQEQLAILQVNVLGAAATIDTAASYFRDRRCGHIIGISSLAALGSLPQQGAYCASKAAFSMYLDATREELRNYGIKTTAILPGFIDTGIIHDPGFDMKKFPFLVSSEKAAKEIIAIAEKGSDVAAIPAYPWKYVKPMIGKIPKPLVRLFKH